MTETTLSRAQAGDGDAFRELTDPYRRELQVHCYRILGSVQDAEDVLQEALLSAWRSIGSFDGGSLRAWLYRIATNRCLNHLRDQSRRPRTAGPLPFPTAAEPVPAGDPSWLEPYPDAWVDEVTPGPEARYEARESIALSFVSALQRLPAQQRAVLVLRDALGFPAFEAAEILGTTPASVNSALLRARGSFDPPRDRDITPLPRSAEERALVDRYAGAVAPIASRIVGHLTAPATRSAEDGESAAADLIADSMLAATRAPDQGGAQLALVNATGVRVDLPGGDVRYEAAFAMMPFGNNLVVMTLTGAQLKAALEQQYGVAIRSGFTKPAVLASSAGFTYAVDLSKPAGSRVVDVRLDGKPVDLGAPYRVALNNYLASGGDNLSAFTAGTDVTDKGIIDLDALVAWIAPGRTPPEPNRIHLIDAR